MQRALNSKFPGRLAFTQSHAPPPKFSGPFSENASKTAAGERAKKQQEEEMKQQTAAKGILFGDKGCCVV